MNQKNSILLIDSDASACAMLQDCILLSADMELIGITSHIEEALSYVRRYLPDFIILDLELHMGSGNGLLFLSQLQLLEPKRRPFIIITTNNRSKITYAAARSYGADLILGKFELGYSAEYVIRTIRTVSAAAIVPREAQSIPHSDDMEPLGSTDHLQQRILEELNRIGISPKDIGYGYLADAILLAIHSSDIKISHAIGEKYNKSPESVNRAIQRSIDKAWYNSDIRQLSVNYTAPIRLEKGAPTVSEFVRYYAAKLGNECMVS